MNDRDRIVEVLKRSLTLQALADAILSLYIEIAGERLQSIEQERVAIYTDILQSQMVKPEYVQTIYMRLNKAKEHINAKRTN